MMTGNNNEGQHMQQSNRRWYRLEKDSSSNGNDGGLAMTVDTVGGMWDGHNKRRKGAIIKLMVGHRCKGGGGGSNNQQYHCHLANGNIFQQ
jgi:hypothetical protein